VTLLKDPAKIGHVGCEYGHGSFGHAKEEALELDLATGQAGGREDGSVVGSRFRAPHKTKKGRPSACRLVVAVWQMVDDWPRRTLFPTDLFWASAECFREGCDLNDETRRHGDTWDRKVQRI